MSGSGYNDAKKLADAKALAMSFGKSSQKGGGGDGGGGKRYGDDFGPKKHQERYNYSPPPTPVEVVSNIPPPSRRNYTDTLMSGPLKHAPGRILGSSPMDFLNRREPSPQQTSTQPPQETPKQSVVAARPPSMTSKPAKDVVQGHNMTTVSGEKSLAVAPIRTDEGPMADTKTKTSMVSSTEQSQPSTKSSIGVAPAQTRNPAPEPLRKNNIAATWGNLLDVSDGEEEEVVQAPKAKFTSEESVLKTPKAEEDLVKVQSPDTKPSTLYRENISKPSLEPTGTTNEIHVQKVRKNNMPPFQENGRGPAQGVSAVKQDYHELASSRDQTRGNIISGEQTKTSNLRPQAPGFVPAPRAVSMDSTMSSSGCLDSASMAKPVATRLRADSPEWTPSDQSHAQYPVAESLDCSPPFSGHLITITPVRIADGFLVPGPTNGHVLMQPQLDTPHHPQASPMQFPAMPLTPGPNLPSQAGKTKIETSVEKPKAPRKTEGLKSSMWAS
ncbi:hypothetical protein ACHAPT_003032 [Fusarium lateritium]